MMEVSVSEQSIEASHNREQQLSACGRYGDSAVEIFGIVNNGSGMIQ
jgi:hypothetical protein